MDHAISLQSLQIPPKKRGVMGGPPSPSPN